MWIISTLLLLISYLAWSIQVLLSPPLRLTRPNPQVPTIPIWVSLLPLFRRWFGLPPLGQDLLYQRYLSPRLERIGAAWIFFGGRWNLLVNDPEAIKQVLNRFEKSGNHIKIPNSVIARLTGSNIISENGQKWKKFRKVLGRPISSPPSDLVDFQTSVDNLFQRIDRSKGKDSLLVNPLLQRYSMDTLCRVLFRVDLGFLSDESPPPELHATHTLVKQNIFDPFFLSFPMLDEEPWVKLFPQRRRARSYVDRLETQLVKALTGKDRGEVSEGTGGSSQKSILLEEMSRAVMEGRWTRREFIDNVKSEKNPYSRHIPL
ncbi:hypothetical protein IE53DRAFT_385311 [Violaceomyces palustris]|uniref:Uncharacterized protein n=1 Tax=Violaceomyces palustris TaxID=1673888 RepID=A0ACD0P2L4_9BASI|nr:hypothetical protein IE53DRAFT_385311 [Violaceomyces palustris]